MSHVHSIRALRARSVRVRRHAVLLSLSVTLLNQVSDAKQLQLADRLLGALLLLLAQPRPVLRKRASPSAFSASRRARAGASLPPPRRGMSAGHGAGSRVAALAAACAAELSRFRSSSSSLRRFSSLARALRCRSFSSSLARSIASRRSCASRRSDPPRASSRAGPLAGGGGGRFCRM
jgi:hypothetical protein